MSQAIATISKRLITVEQPGHPTHQFRIVKKVPKGYGVWAIGEHMGTEDYVPFFEPKPNYGPYSVNSDTLLAVKLPRDDVLLLRYVAVRYGGTVTGLSRACARKSTTVEEREKITRAIAILEQIKEER